MNNIEKLELAIDNKEKYCILVFDRELNPSDYKIKGYTVTRILDDKGNLIEQSFLVENMSEYLAFLKPSMDEQNILLPESVELIPSENVVIAEPIKRKKSNLNKNM